MSPLNITQPLDSIRYMVYNGYYKVMSNIPKMGHLTTPVKLDGGQQCIEHEITRWTTYLAVNPYLNAPEGTKSHDRASFKQHWGITLRIVQGRF